MRPEQFRICNVSYLNGAPYRVLSDLGWVSYDECEPAECARRLHEDECDLALIPVVDFLSHGGYEALAFGIAARERVESVAVFSHTPFADLKSIRVDPASHTSVALLRVLVENSKAIVSQDINVDLTADEGQLLIGNRALEAATRFQYATDLAELWWKREKLPFTFAVWAFRPERLSDDRRHLIEAAIAKGLENRLVYARACAESAQIDRGFAEEYVTSRIEYRFGPEHLAGRERFQEKLSELNRIPKRRSRDVDTILSAAAEGRRIGVTEALMIAQHASLADLAIAANELKLKLHPKPAVSYIVDRNINYTNVCNVYCRFCAFYSAPNKVGGYLLTKEEIGKKIEETVDAGGIQILLQGGLNPELGIEYYEDLFRWIKARYPINLHALSSDEVWHIVHVSKLSLREVLTRLIAAGMGSLPGGGAEILVDRVRRRIARLKTDTMRWLEAHRTAHQLGITSTCTMMFGVLETWEDRILHLEKLRQLQDETGGFTAFITWPFQEDNTSLEPGDTSAPEYLRVQAISRLFLDNIPNIQSSWVTQGPSVGQVALFFGANDFGSVMFEENVVSAAGTTYSMDAALIEAHIRQAGFEPWQRTVHYQPVGTPASI